MMFKRYIILNISIVVIINICIYYYFNHFKTNSNFTKLMNILNIISKTMIQNLHLHNHRNHLHSHRQLLYLDFFQALLEV